MPIRTVSTQEHRRHSMLFDKNVIVAITENPDDAAQPPVVDSETLETITKSDDCNSPLGTNTTAYRFQPSNHKTSDHRSSRQPSDQNQEHSETYACWSDEEDDGVNNYSIYPTLSSGNTPSSSTPYKYSSAAAAPTLECDVSEVTDYCANTALSHLDETNRK